MSQKFKNKIDVYTGKLLRYGVLVSCGITVFGGILYMFQYHGKMPDYSPVPFGEPFGVSENLRGISGIVRGLLKLDGASVIQLGIIVLIATPVLRVAFSAVAFLIEKDRQYFAITVTVLIIIIINMIFGLH
ncbi:MAG: DUF1634 domain-containing protein [Prevotellaceae bacterium]|jgi:uncharacterized membrane protein|nr:DUF1634 domain-containing protein [Prevotellaceae bacterium]